MYVGCPIPGPGLGGVGHVGQLGKFKFKKIFRAPARILRAPMKIVKKAAKAAPRVVKKLAPAAALAAGAYFLPTIAASVLPRILAGRGGAAPEAMPAPGPAPSWPEPSAPATPREALATAAQAYFASRYPTYAPPPQPFAYAPPPPPQPFYYEPAPQAPATPAPAQAGFGLKKIPPALLAAGAAIPLLFFLMPRSRGRRR